MNEIARGATSSLVRPAAIAGLACCAAAALLGVARGDEPAAKELPPAASRAVDFHKDVLPLLARRCASCHTGGKKEGGLSMSSRESLLKGGDSGPAVVSGESAKSLLIQLAAGTDPDRIMPAKGQRLSASEVGLLRAWIDRGIEWEKGIRLNDASASQAPLSPRRPELPPARDPSVTHPIDRLLDAYVGSHGLALGEPVSDRLFARRAYLDLIGLLPPPDELVAFEQDPKSDKRPRLVRRLLDDREAFAFHWLTFWNDLLRNDYRGTGFIDKGREQITGWLFESLYNNKPYDQFVRELISPVEGSAGFTKGIYWRGVVNASQRREMQASQMIGQVLLGTNLKCASCHDSFVNHWKLADSYGLAAVFASEPLEIHHCDKPTGEKAQAAFVYPQLGSIDPKASVKDRGDQLAKIMTDPRNGRLARTVVNRLWERFFGRGIVAQVDDMDRPPFSADLLDWLAADFQDHGYDLNHTIELICTSRAYQAASVGAPKASEQPFVFHGPVTRRLSAEQFADAVSTMTGVWQAETPEMLQKDGRGQGGQLTAVAEVLSRQRQPNGSLPLIAGHDGQAIELDGTTHTIRIAHDARLKPTEQLTITAWISPRDCPDVWQTIYRKEDGVGRTVLAIGGANERFGLWFGLGVDDKYREIGVPLVRVELKDGNWHFVAASYDATNLRLFVDGRELRAEAAAGPIDVRGESPAFIGSREGTGEFFRGGIDDVRLYDRALSAQDLKAISAGVEPPLEPVARWKFDGNLEDARREASGVLIGPRVRPRLMRAALAENSALLSSLGRPNREQVVSVRDPLTTTLQALELTNGADLDGYLRRGAKRWMERSLPARLLVQEMYIFALGRAPTPAEAEIAERRLGTPATEENIQDFLWEVLMLPELQLIH